jgi:hypothetical protein
MPKRIASLVVAVVLLAGAGLITYRTLRGGSALRPGISGERVVAGTGPARILLNEIVFQPVSGQPPWVELINAGGESATLGGVALRNQDGADYSLPASIALAAGGIVLVRFDGSARTEGATVHAEPTTFLHREAGSLTLIVRGQPEDDAFWSTNGGLSLNLGRGGRIPRFRPGTSVGRPRGSAARSPDAWTVFSPPETTPGAVNPYPAVTGLMPLSGAVLKQSTVTLSWYSVPTANRYRVLVATDRSFGAPLFDQTVDAPPGNAPTTAGVRVDAPRPGRYYWRVQAVFSDGHTAAVSRTAVFWTTAAPAAAKRFDDFSFVATASAAPAPVDSRRRTLTVPLILQRKDTRLLALEAETEVGARPWDAPWQNPPVGPFCGRASIAMITAFYRGRLSQDRITYEAFKDFRPGPIFDLYPKNGFGDGNIHKAMTYALGGEPTLRFTETWTLKEYFEQHKLLIDQGLPVVATTDVHVFVVVGYGEDERGKYLTINDPAIGQYDWLLVPRPGIEDGDRTAPFFDEGKSTSFVPPPNARGKSDEPEIALDSDGDGVMDFDETKRFGTSRYSADSDNDGVRDKEEIRAWVYDVAYGWARTNPNGRPFDVDEDDKRMEVDEDSDAGGCFDGMEDQNANGKYEPDRKELYNFQKDDDPCIKGIYEVVADSIDHSRGPQGLITSKVREAATISLRPEPDGKVKGLAAFSYMTSSEQHVPPTGCLSTVKSPEPTRWTVTLEGAWKLLSDGATELTIKATPTQGPMHRYDWTNACPPGASGSDVMPTLYFFGFGPLKLANGKFELRTDTPLGPQRIGTQYTLIRLEQRRPEAPRR